jgi:hypothetical protein
LAEEERDRLHDTAALRALAGGEDVTSDAPTEGPEASEDEMFPDEPGEYSAVGAEILSTCEDETGQAEFPTASSAPRRVRNAQMAVQQAHALSIQFRKTAIPLLFVLAGLLLVVGGFTWLKVSGADPEELVGNPLLENGKLFSAIAIVLALCLIAGGAFFHHEIKRHTKYRG